MSTKTNGSRDAQAPKYTSTGAFDGQTSVDEGQALDFAIHSMLPSRAAFCVKNLLATVKLSLASRAKIVTPIHL